MLLFKDMAQEELRSTISSQTGGFLYFIANLSNYKEKNDYFI
jgi:hypothetical protein